MLLFIVSCLIFWAVIKLVLAISIGLAQILIAGIVLTILYNVFTSIL